MYSRQKTLLINTKAFVYIFLFLVVSYPQDSLSQHDINSATKSSIRYNVELIGIKKGLNSSDITALFQDSDGYIWVGNKPGCSRFDGHIFDNFKLDDGSTIGQVHSIIQDSSGTIWIAGTPGLLYFKNGKFHKTIVENYAIRDLHIGKKGELWVVGLGFVPFTLTNRDLLQLKKGKLIDINPIVSRQEWNEKITSFRVWAIDTDDDGIAWFGLDNQHAFFDGNHLSVVWSDPSANYKYCMVEAIHHDSIYWGSEIIPMKLQGRNEWTNIGNLACYMSYRTDSCIYFQNTLQLVQLCAGKWKILHTLDKFLSIYPRKFIRDIEGNFWLGGMGILLKFSPSNFQHWSVADFSELSLNQCLARNHSGELIVGSHSGKLIKKTNEIFQHHQTLPVSSGSLVAAVHMDNNGWEWYGTTLNGIVLQRNGNFEVYDQEKGLGDNGQLFFFENSNGEFWSGGDAGIIRIHISKFGELSFENYMVDFQDNEMLIFRNMFESPDGHMWAVGDQGLYKLKNKELVNWTFPSPVSQRPIITSAIIDQKDQLWLSTQGEGLWQCRFNKSNNPVLIKQWSKNDGLLSNILLDVHVDQQDRIWVVSSNGICYLELNQDSVRLKCLDERDGWHSTPTSHAKFLETSDSILWVMYSTSITSLALYDLPENKQSPKSFITQIELFDGNEDIYQYAENKSVASGLPYRLTLPYDKNFLRFHFTSTSQTQPNKNKFRYKLEGLDPQWNEIVKKQPILYPGLQPGEYTFNVLSANNSGVWGTTPASYTFIITPPWYRTLRAYMVVTLFILTIIYAFYRFQLSRKISQQEAKRLTELDTFKTKFYANITHEFRTPLTIIQGMADELGPREDQEEQSKLNLIKKNSDNLLGLVNQLLDLSKLKAGKVSVNLHQDDIIVFLKYLVEAHESFAKSQEIGLQFYSDEKQLYMDFDPRMIEQVLTNLISNAIKFTPQYGKILVVAKSINDDNSPRLHILVKDNGIGIPAEELPFIFDRFHQANIDQFNQGSGIGLALVSELMNTMKATINVESEVDKGTSFSLEFPISNDGPLVSSSHQFATETLARPSDVAFKLENKTNDERPILLIIEDNADVLIYLHACLKDSYQLITSHNGKEGVEKALETLPDIIISDVMMPKMDGFEVCAKLKGDDRTNHIPIILLTAKATSEDKIKGLSHGADAYLIKPFEKEELMIRLEKLMLLRKTLQQKYSEGLLTDAKDESGVEDQVAHFIRKVEKEVLVNLDDDTFSVNELAQVLFLSRSQVHRKIKALTGMSTSIYIRKIRLLKAKELIRSTDLSISEIAYAVGFKSPAYFSQVFKESFGENPSAMR